MDRSLWDAGVLQPRLSAVLLIGIVLALYWPALSFGFVYEDFNDVERFLQPWGLYAQRTDLRIDRFLTLWTFGVSYSLTPMEPWGYHFVSIVLHAFNTVLLYCLARYVFPGVWLPFVCAALFAVHPLNSEAVAYISARADLVMTTGLLFALLAAEREYWIWLLVGCVVAFMGKESGVVSIVLALFWAAWRGRRVPRWLVSGLVFGVVCVGVGQWAYHTLPGFDLRSTARELTAVWVLASKALVPLHFSIDHDVAMPVWAPWIVLVGSCGLVAIAVQQRTAWAFGVLFLLITLSPRLLVPLVEGLHERHLYAPMVGISLALVGVCAKGLYGVSETPA